MANNYLIFDNSNNDIINGLVDLGKEHLEPNELINIVTLMNIIGNDYEDYCDYLSSISSYNFALYNYNQYYTVSGYVNANTDIAVLNTRPIINVNVTEEFADSNFSFEYIGTSETLFGDDWSDNYVKDSPEDPAYSLPPVDIYEMSYEHFAIIKNKIKSIKHIDSEVYFSFRNSSLLSLNNEGTFYSSNSTEYTIYIPPLLYSHFVGYNGFYILGVLEPEECKSLTFRSNNKEYNGVLFTEYGIILPKNNYIINGGND